MGESVGDDVAAYCSIRSSPTALAAARPSSTSPCSIMSGWVSWVSRAQTPAKQSACSSIITDSRLASPRGSLAELGHLARDAEQGLHVMADLVRNHIGLGEVAGRTELLVESSKNERSR